MRAAVLALTILALFAGPASAADVFERHTPYWLRQAMRGAEPLEELSSGDATEFKSLSARITSPCVIVKTDQDNLAKALVGWGFRRGADGKVVPVLMIERYVTYDGQREGIAVASGKDVMLFAGFRFNFDFGQVVPEGHGADLLFTAERTIKPAGDAQLYPLDGSQLPALKPGEKAAPTDRADVQPTDFSGTWQVDVDGRWTGSMRLTVNEDGTAFGQLFSDETKSAYVVKGQVSRLPHRIDLDIEFGGTLLHLEAYLWTEDKHALAGPATIAERRFGFYAVRDDESDRKDAGKDRTEGATKPEAEPTK